MSDIGFAMFHSIQYQNFSESIILHCVFVHFVGGAMKGGGVFVWVDFNINSVSKKLLALMHLP